MATLSLDVSLAALAPAVKNSTGFPVGVWGGTALAGVVDRVWGERKDGVKRPPLWERFLVLQNWMVLRLFWQDMSESWKSGRIVKRDAREN